MDVNWVGAWLTRGRKAFTVRGFPFLRYTRQENSCNNNVNQQRGPRERRRRETGGPGGGHGPRDVAAPPPHTQMPLA